MRHTRYHPNQNIELSAVAAQALKAVAEARVGQVESINWRVVTASGQNTLNPPTFVDSNCSNLSRTGDTISSKVTCKTILVVPQLGNLGALVQQINS